MKTILRKVAPLLLAAHVATLQRVEAVKVGDDVCITGYIMDNFCMKYQSKTTNIWEGGYLLDDDKVETLHHPEEHSFHCLLDVGVCSDSGYQVLGPKDPVTERHCPGFRIDDAAAVLAAGRALGKCSTCEDEDGPEFGYRATVRGTVKEMGDGSDDKVKGPPLLTKVQMLDESEGCNGLDTVPPLCGDRSTSPGEEEAGEPMPSFSPTIAPFENMPSSASPAGPVLSCPETLEGAVAIDDVATLYYAIVRSDPGADNGILCGRLEAQNDGWIALAISEDGKMLDSEAIIGLPADGTVQKYDMAEKSIDGVWPMFPNKQTLRDASFVIDEMTGMAVMEFTKLLVEEGEIPILVEGANTFLHARGGQDLGYHGGNRLSFEVDFAVAATPEPTTPPSVSPIAPPPSTSPAKSPTTSPSVSSIASPSSSPAKSPSVGPSESPVPAPSMSPVQAPSTSPVVVMIGRPATPPSANPVSTTLSPSSSPMASPSTSPVVVEGVATTMSPSGSPTKQPTESPTPPPNLFITTTNDPTLAPNVTATTTGTPTQVTNSTNSTATTGSPTSDHIIFTGHRTTSAPTVKNTGSTSETPTAKPVAAPEPPPSPSGGWRLGPGLVALVFAWATGASCGVHW